MIKCTTIRSWNRAIDSLRKASICSLRISSMIKFRNVRLRPLRPQSVGIIRRSIKCLPMRSAEWRSSAIPRSNRFRALDISALLAIFHLVHHEDPLFQYSFPEAKLQHPSRTPRLGPEAFDRSKQGSQFRSCASRQVHPQNAWIVVPER